jgi:hypothetical protein
MAEWGEGEVEAKLETVNKREFIQCIVSSGLGNQKVCDIDYNFEHTLFLADHWSLNDIDLKTFKYYSGRIM